jgi:prepilin-type N-terminal cleavage/methylation domain-containing protein
MHAFLGVFARVWRHMIGPMRQPSARGFTLLELCVGLALVALLAGMAAPSFRHGLRNAAVRAAAHELMTGLQQAVCLADSAGNCRDSDSAGSWSAHLEFDAATRPIAARTLPAGITLRSTRSRIRFSARALASSTATLTICDAQGVATPRAIVLSQNARARFAVASEAACRS